MIYNQDAKLEYPLCKKCGMSIKTDQKRSTRRRVCDECKQKNKIASYKRWYDKKFKSWRDTQRSVTIHVRITKAHQEFLEKNFIDMGKFVCGKLDQLVASFDEHDRQAQA